MAPKASPNSCLHQQTQLSTNMKLERPEKGNGRICHIFRLTESMTKASRPPATASFRRAAKQRGRKSQNGRFLLMAPPDVSLIK